MGNTKSRYSPQELLDYYIERKDTPNIEEILQKNPEVIDKPINKHTKQTALMRACFNGNLELAKIFKAAGANVNAVNKKGDTALATAVKRNHIQMVQYLIQGGADVRFATDSGIKIIDYAILSGFYDIAKLVYTHLSQRDRELKPVEQYEALAKKYAYRYVNYEVVMRGLQQGLTLNEIPNFLKKQKPKLVDPVVDPRQTWTDWAKRTIQFKDAPLVQRQNLPQHLQPQNRLIGKLHHYTHNFMSTKGSRKPSLHPIRNQTGYLNCDLGRKCKICNLTIQKKLSVFLRQFLYYFDNMDPDQRQKVTAKDGDKTITRTLKYIEKVHRQQILFHKDIAKKTTVINVKVKYLRQLGYDSFLDWLKDPSHIYIGRNMTVYVPGAEKSIWANPFSVDKYGREQCLDKYKKYLLEDKTLLARVQQLQGKVLGCWCKPEGCHGDILAQLADSL